MLLLLVSLLIQAPLFAATPITRLDLASTTNLNENKIDIAPIALRLASEVFENLDTKKYLSSIDQMANDIRIRTKGIKDPDFRLRVMNTYLFKEKGFRYDLDDPTVRLPENRYINGLLDRKKGSCITFPLLYVILGQKLGYPIYPVLVPDHTFVRYTDVKFKDQNIETTSGGGYVPDWKYKADFGISEKSIESGAYLKTLTYREYLSELISLNGVFHFLENKDTERGLSYLGAAIKLRPNTPEAHFAKSKLLRKMAHHFLVLNKISQFKNYNSQAEEQEKIAIKLGLIRPDRRQYLKEAERKKMSQSGTRVNQ